MSPNARGTIADWVPGGNPLYEPVYFIF